MDKAKFAFGSWSRLSEALSSGAVDSYDLLCLVDDGVARIGWVSKDGEPILVDTEPRVVAVDALPEAGEPGIIYIVGEVVYIWAGSKFVAISESTDLTALKEHVSVFEEKVVSLEGQVSTLEDKSVAVEEQMISIDERVAVVEGQTSVLEEKASALEVEVAEKADVDEVKAKYLQRTHEIIKVPDGSLVDYREGEIRIMVPADTDWATQENASSTAEDPNLFYLELRIYAPEDAVKFRDGSGITDETPMYDFNHIYAGTDEFGRNYIVVYLPIARRDDESSPWTYFGAKSTTDHFIGWDYEAEWYDVDGKMFSYDNIKITLSNEDCHFQIEPYFVGDMKSEIKSYTEELIDAKIEEVTEIPVVEF